MLGTMRKSRHREKSIKPPISGNRVSCCCEHGPVLAAKSVDSAQELETLKYSGVRQND